jgi:hypothetical protein
MSAFKKLSKSDVTVVPYAANKQWNITQCSYPTSSEYFTLYKGTNVTGSFNPDTDPITNDQYERLVYSQINHLFYQTYSASLNTSSLMFTLNNYESASQQRPTSSYFIYNDNANQIKSFPTGAMNSIKVVSINQDIYGNKVLPNTFVLTSSAYSITDDGFGNLYNYGTTHIGNIFYAHGLAIITNQASQSIFPDPPFALPINLNYTTNTIPSNFDYYGYVNRRDFELDGDTLILSGSPYFTNQDTNIIGFTGTLPGVYETYYSIASRDLGCGSVYSNTAKITLTITKVTDCNFNAYATSTIIGCNFTLNVNSSSPAPTTASPTTAAPTTAAPTTAAPTTAAPTNAPTPPPTFAPTAAPTTAAPTTAAPTAAPTTAAPTAAPTTAAPTTAAPTTAAPTTAAPTTAAPTTAAPTTAAPTTAAPTTAAPTTAAPTTASPTPAPTAAIDCTLAGTLTVVPIPTPSPTPIDCTLAGTLSLLYCDLNGNIILN